MFLPDVGGADFGMTPSRAGLGGKPPLQKREQAPALHIGRSLMRRTVQPSEPHRGQVMRPNDAWPVGNWLTTVASAVGLR